MLAILAPPEALVEHFGKKFAGAQANVVHQGRGQAFAQSERKKALEKN
jgi:hypothetical protein